MKTSKLTEYLFNPFKRIAGWQALLIGLVFLAATAIISKYSNIIFDGVIDVHFAKNISLNQSFLLLSIDVFSVVVCLWIGGLFINRKFRFIDILGTITLARAPMIIMAILAFPVNAPDYQTIISQPLSVLKNIPFIIVMILSLPILIWTISLMYRAFKISIGGNNSNLITIFIAGLFVAEVLSKLLIYIYL